MQFISVYSIHFYFKYSSLAQSVEHLTVNQVVAGSSPAGGAKKETKEFSLVSFLIFQEWPKHTNLLAN